MLSHFLHLCLLHEHFATQIHTHAHTQTYTHTHTHSHMCRKGTCFSESQDSRGKPASSFLVGHTLEKYIYTVLECMRADLG